MENIRIADHSIYGIDWDQTDEPVKRSKNYHQFHRPTCQFKDCKNLVSTEENKPKPYCLNHVFENQYVKDLLKRMENERITT